MRQSFSRHRSALFSAREAKSFEVGLAIALDAHDQYPREHARTYYWQACMLSLLGRGEEALDVLEKSLTEGAWRNPQLLEADPDLSALRGEARFIAIVRECVKLHAERQLVSKPECLLMGPASAVWEPRWIFALHQRGQNARECAENWLPLVNEGWGLAVAQSSQVFDSATFSWDDSERARVEVRDHLRDCVGKRGMNPDGLVLAGVSQGAPLALEIAHETGVPWLCVIPGFPAGYDLAPLLGTPLSLKGAFLVGEKDPHTARSLRVSDTLRSAGASVMTFVMPGVGHELAEDFVTYARQALVWILDSAASVP